MTAVAAPIETGSVGLRPNNTLFTFYQTLANAGYHVIPAPNNPYQTNINDLQTISVQQGGLTLHIWNHYGENNHHIVESCFKGLARSLREAVAPDERLDGGIASTKGTLGDKP